MNAEARALPIYLDHNATTPLDPTVVEAMLPFLEHHFGNRRALRDRLLRRLQELVPGGVMLDGHTQTACRTRST